VARPVPIHNLRGNETEWSPPTVISFDTETRPIPGTEPEILALRLWSARVDYRRPSSAAKSVRRTGRGHTTAELAAWIDQQTKGEGAVWCFAHNLSFDLAATRLPLALADDGWTITDFAVSGPSPWVRMHKGRRTLTMTDSWSWLPDALAKIGEAVGVVKPDLPDDDDSDAAWWARCDGDVDILATAVLDLMDWWDRNRKGRWSITGASTGWNAYRHTPTTRKVKIDTDPDGIAFDRLAVRGGRRDAWRSGSFRAGPYYELDVTDAHPTIAATLPLPCGRTAHVRGVDADDYRIGGERWGLIAECVVRTSEPRWPVRLHNLTWWPTGTFRTVLAGPELAEARRLGELVSVGPGWMHQLGHHMAPWARWCLDLAHGRTDDAPAVARMAAKSWGRSVVGKWAGHTHRTIRLGAAPSLGWGIERGYDHRSSARGAMVDMAGQRWWTVADQNTDNAYPAVLAWVESELRVRMARIIDLLGPDALLQCDTDGMLVSGPRLDTPAVRRRLGIASSVKGAAMLPATLDRLNLAIAPLSIRVKRTYDTVTVLGPQHMILDGTRRLAGIRKDATDEGGGRYVARAWPKLAWQMERGSTAGYSRPLFRSVLTGPYVQRWEAADGSLLPPQARIGADGRTELVPWSEMDPRPALDLPVVQAHPILAKLV